MSEQPRNPRIVLAAALLVPGSGHVLLGDGRRGLTFLFFIIILGWASSHLMPETASIVGRFIGGVFVYGISVIDAYKQARVRYEIWKATNEKDGS